MPYIKNNQIVNVNLHTLRYLIGDLSFSCLFQISIPFIETSVNESLTISALAKTTSLPSYNIGDASIDFHGRKIKFADNASFDEWTVSFLCDEYHKLRHKFLTWQSLIYDPRRDVLYSPHSYKKNGVKVTLLSKNGEPVTGYEFFGMFPKKVGEIQLNHQKNINEFSVTFDYDYYIINSTFDTKNLYVDKKVFEALSNISNDKYSYVPINNTTVV
ncbi:MAG: hypothetical protein NZZ41_01105 [Candidatus Dojkabacteria bacterium]|nr:hypothetical protein [Candidatus Dojkabacteria bacterium]